MKTNSKRVLLNLIAFFIVANFTQPTISLGYLIFTRIVDLSFIEYLKFGANLAAVISGLGLLFYANWARWIIICLVFVRSIKLGYLFYSMRGGEANLFGKIAPFVLFFIIFMIILFLFRASDITRTSDPINRRSRTGFGVFALLIGIGLFFVISLKDNPDPIDQVNIKENLTFLDRSQNWKVYQLRFDKVIKGKQTFKPVYASELHIEQIKGEWIIRGCPPFTKSEITVDPLTGLMNIEGNLFSGSPFSSTKLLWQDRAALGVEFVKPYGKISGRILILDQENLKILILMDVCVWGKELETYFECEADSDIPPISSEIITPKAASISN